MPIPSRGAARYAPNKTIRHDHDHRSDKTEFLADHRINKIRVRFRQVEKLLFALHQAYAREATRADGNERLKQLKSGALRIRIRMQKSHQPGLPVRYLRNKQIDNGNRPSEPHREPLP